MTFDEIWPLVKDRTLLHRHKARMLYDLVTLRPADTDVAECGVFRGGMTAMMAMQIEEGLTAHGFESFEGLPIERAPAESCYYAAGALETTYDDTMEFLSRLPGWTRSQIVRGRFEDTLPSFELPLGLVHVDCDVYSSAKTCVDHLYDNLVEGGIMVFDDFHDLGGGVALAVAEHVRQTHEVIYAGPIEQAFVVKGRTWSDLDNHPGAHWLDQREPLWDPDGDVLLNVSAVTGSREYLQDLSSGAALPDLPGRSLAEARKYALRLLAMIKWHERVLAKGRP